MSNFSIIAIERVKNFNILSPLECDFQIQDQICI